MFPLQPLQLLLCVVESLSAPVPSLLWSPSQWVSRVSTVPRRQVRVYGGHERGHVQWELRCGVRVRCWQHQPPRLHLPRRQVCHHRVGVVHQLQCGHLWCHGSHGVVFLHRALRGRVLVPCRLHVALKHSLVGAHA